MKNPLVNIFSVDLEDWHQLARRQITNGPPAAPSDHVARQLDALLRLLDNCGVEATFFVLGVLAERRPRRLDAFEPRNVGQRLRAARLNVHQNVGRRSLVGKVERLLKAFPFTSFRGCLYGADVPASEALLPFQEQMAPAFAN